jgi:Transposase DDE domain
MGTPFFRIGRNGAGGERGMNEARSPAAVYGSTLLRSALRSSLHLSPSALRALRTGPGPATPRLTQPLPVCAILSGIRLHKFFSCARDGSWRIIAAMAAKRYPERTPRPSQRPERAGFAPPPARDLPVWPEQVVGGKYVHTLDKLIQELRGTDAHGNRELFLDDVFTAYLLAFFNPSLRSLRTLEDFSQTRQAQRHLSIPKLCKSTLSDFNQLADPTRLQPIIDHLRREVLKPGRDRPTNALEGLHRQVLAVDGTFLHAAADIVWAIGRRGSKSGGRLDFTVDVNTWLPEVLAIGSPDDTEAKNAAATITPSAIHLYDRGVFSFELVAAHHGIADFVMRIRESGERCPKFTATEERAITESARKAGVVSDRVGYLTGSHNHKAPKVLLREVVIIPPEDPENPTRSRDPVRLLTTLLDLDAAVIGLLYRHRWQVELFFRWLKCYAHFDHMISHNREGVLLNFYVAVIAVMMMYLHSGSRPSKYLFSLMSLVASGASTMEEIMPILRERERRNQLERERVARKRAEKSR